MLQRENKTSFTEDSCAGIWLLRSLYLKGKTPLLFLSVKITRMGGTCGAPGKKKTLRVKDSKDQAFFWKSLWKTSPFTLFTHLASPISCYSNPRLALQDKYIFMYVFLVKCVPIQKFSDYPPQPWNQHSELKEDLWRKKKNIAALDSKLVNT